LHTARPCPPVSLSLQPDGPKGDEEKGGSGRRRKYRFTCRGEGEDESRDASDDDSDSGGSAARAAVRGKQPRMEWVRRDVTRATRRPRRMRRDATCTTRLPTPPGSPYPNYEPISPHDSIEIAAYRALQEGEQRLEKAEEQVASYVRALYQRCERKDPATAALHQIVRARAAGKKRRALELVDKWSKRCRSSTGRSYYSRQRKHLTQAKSLRATLQLATRAVNEAVESLGAPTGL